MSPGAAGSAASSGSPGRSNRPVVETAASNGDNGGVAPRIPSLLAPPIAFAHRGARAQARENTMEAFELAHRLGATGIETDAWLTADGAVVLDHDGRCRRWGFWRRRFGSTDRDRLPAHVPTLDEYYRHFGSALPLSVDVKDPAAFDGLVAVARAHGAESGLWVCHGDLEVLGRWREAAPDVKLVASVRLARIAGPVERWAAELARIGIDAVNLRRPDWNGGLTTLFHRFGVLAFGWDAQHTHHIAELIDMGIDAFYSDHVDRMVEAIAQFHH